MDGDDESMLLLHGDIRLPDTVSLHPLLDKKYMFVK
jgi:hypothetical protein